jgi:hypothetical protein
VPLRAPSSTLVIALACLASSPASAASWVKNRTTPSLKYLVAIDATGEADWLWGQEDVAGDGLDAFLEPEQSLDLRSAYFASDPNDLWARIYVSDQNAVSATAIVFFFVDSDRSNGTGGPGMAPEIHAMLTSDPSPGGYDFVIGVKGNGQPVDIWSWREQPRRYEPLANQPTIFTGEAGRDADPLRVHGDVHGYTQVRVPIGVVRVGPSCEANVFVRSVNDTQGAMFSDLDLGIVAPCIPKDENNDKIPDVLNPPNGCVRDDQCPGRGICSNEVCVYAVPCDESADCGSGFECAPDGRCVPPAGGMCSSTAQCDELICLNSRCVACDPRQAQCGEDRRCAPDGRCVSGDGTVVLNPGELVEGGACNCRSTADERGFAAGALLLLLAMMRRRAR